jgi:peptidoglycan hydrolase-like protein with peptidoglycan-binding domain
VWVAGADDEKEVTWTLKVGGLRPIDEVEGYEARLANLGYDVGTIDGAADEKTQAAIEHFQHDQGLPVTGEMDDETKQHLNAAYKGV